MLDAQAAGATEVDRVAADLSALPVPLVMDVFEGLLSRKGVSASHAPLATVLRLVLTEGADGGGLLDDPRRLYDSAHQVFTDYSIRVQAQRAVLDQPMLTATAVGEALRSSGKNLREAASRLRRHGTLLGVPSPQGQGYAFPAFQIDPLAARIRPVVASVNLALDALADPWGVASWWISPDERLPAGQAPKDLIDTDTESDLLVMVGAAPPALASDARAASADLPA